MLNRASTLTNYPMVGKWGAVNATTPEAIVDPGDARALERKLCASVISDLSEPARASRKTTTSSSSSSEGVVRGVFVRGERVQKQKSKDPTLRVQPAIA